jgi:hypothetical protein
LIGKVILGIFSHDRNTTENALIYDRTFAEVRDYLRQSDQLIAGFAILLGVTTFPKIQSAMLHFLICQPLPATQ